MKNGFLSYVASLIFPSLPLMILLLLLLAVSFIGLLVIVTSINNAYGDKLGEN